MKRFITKYYFLPAVALLTLVSVVAVRCKKPTDGININVNTSNLFHYTALVQVVDPSGLVPAGLSVTATGTNAAAVYGLDGRKALGAPAGVIAVAIHPKMEPTASTPVKFNLVISGPNYLTLTVPVSITVDQKTQVIQASILNLTVPTAGVASATVTATVAAGTVATPIAVTTPASGSAPVAAVTVPTGTRLQDANGNTINGTAVAATVNSFNAAQSDALALFPGSSLTTTNYVDNTGSTTSAALIPAGFANIQMSVNGTDVKKFSSPIAVSMNLDPAFVNPNTGATIAAGQTVEIDSYDTGTGQWKFEQNATVSIVGGNPVVNFTTTHLTVYTAVIRLGIQTSLRFKLTTSAPIGADQSYAVTYAAVYTNRASVKLKVGTLVLTDDGIALANGFDFGGQFPVPTATSTITVFFYAINDVGQTTPIGTTVLSAGATTATINITLPAPGPLTDLILKLDCSGAGSSKVGILTPPDFYLQFKPTGAPNTSYKVLGMVQNGELITNQLLSTQNYDFRAVLGGNNYKEVINHNISENIPANQVVGGTFNGNKAASFNQLDIRSLCNTLP